MGTWGHPWRALTAQLVHWCCLQNPEVSSYLEALMGWRRAPCSGRACDPLWLGPVALLFGWWSHSCPAFFCHLEASHPGSHLRMSRWCTSAQTWCLPSWPSMKMVFFQCHITRNTSRGWQTAATPGSHCPWPSLLLLLLCPSVICRCSHST
jgi:hypothetical protein